MQQAGDLARKRVDRIIIENEMLRAGFAAFPYLVMRDKTLSVGTRLAYAFLLMYAWQEGSCFASQEKMAGEIGVSARHLRRYLSELKETGYVRIERKDKRFNNTYVILDKRPSKLKARRGKAA
jgi:DNA-binding transcriptional ArsR family regulator